MKKRNQLKSYRKFAVEALSGATSKDKNLYSDFETAFEFAPLNSFIYPVEVIIIK